jgi:hypothetical protein
MARYDYNNVEKGPPVPPPARLAAGVAAELTVTKIAAATNNAGAGVPALPGLSRGFCGAVLELDEVG